MTSKKATFESRDPSHLADGKTDISSSEGGGSSGKASFSSSDPAYLADNPLDEPISLDDSIAPEDLLPQDEGVSDKASFYVPDPDLGKNNPENSGKGSYTGVERRKHNRRSGKERRTDVRFELDKTDRRQNEGRRADDHTPKYW